MLFILSVVVVVGVSNQPNHAGSGGSGGGVLKKTIEHLSENTDIAIKVGDGGGPNGDGELSFIKYDNIEMYAYGSKSGQSGPAMTFVDGKGWDGGVGGTTSTNTTVDTSCGWR